ncbi:tachykinins-like [Portunus trituberculatus]|uniref:tachykinins-like n=1 Tax=Portunus trituberculatus TaxID=210409 RepID=UPI001E1CFF3C|nr:tachykinins-like [Portunus trituberculatus]
MSRMMMWAAVVLMGVAAAAAGGAEQGEAGSDGPRPRRAPSGFLGMRGKKEAPSPSLQDAPAPPEDLLPSFYQLDVPLRGKKAPSGFLGMRGKKSEEEEEEEEEGMYAHPSFNSEFDSLVKRYPSGFLGMRGKKAPSGFLGMRGKKSSIEDYLSSPVSRQALLSLLQGDAAPPMDDDYYYYYNPEGWRAGTHKRAPSGFLGMRGKKDAYPGLPQDKRTPSGFLGMRG